MANPSNSTLDYKSAGVDIQAGNELIRLIKPIARNTNRPGVMQGLGGFGSLFELPLDRYRNPVLVSGTDGVGTKLKLAIELGQHQTVGIDLVAMSVNDIVVQGAEPLFFLDYFATGKLDVNIAAAVIEGIGNGCKTAGAALIGGETAEMPGMYGQQDYDLAGFCVGIVEKDQIIDGGRCSVGDRLIGLASSGPHSNGYSLIRKLIETQHISLQDAFEGRTIGDFLIEPTRIYVKPILELINSVDVRGIAHITGGGITENLPRILPKNIAASINLTAWKRPPIFSWIQQTGSIEQSEMLRTFNCGIGMIVCVSVNDEEEALKKLANTGERAFSIGTLIGVDGDPRVEYIDD